MWENAEIIDTVSRADLIEAGELVEAGDMAREAGFVFPVALTRAVWEDCVVWTQADAKRTGAIQDQTGRLWDVLWMASQAARRSLGGRNAVTFQIMRVDRERRGYKPRLVTLKLHIGPGDTPEPVMTIMQPHED